MNGRVYDPVIGRFLSPDPYVQAPYSSQSYNRYSYVWNNPLSAVDPSGYAGGTIVLDNYGVTILPPITVYADDAAGYTLTYSSPLQSVDAEQARLDQIAGNSPFGPSLQPDLSRVDQVGLNWALTRASSDPSLFNDVASRISVAQLHLGERIANFNGKVSVDAARYYREEVGRAVEDFACTIGDCGAVAVEPDRIALEWTIGGKMFSGLLGVARSLEARVVTKGGKPGSYTPDRQLPTNGRDYIPDSDLPHTQLGRSKPKYGSEPQAREWGYDANGNLIPKKDIDFTDHGYPDQHPWVPHQHPLIPNNPKTAPRGGFRRGDGEPLQ